MKHIQTKSGFEVDLDESTLDNMELIDAIAEASENATSASTIIKILFGEEDKKRLYDHLRNDNGVVPVTGVMREVEEIFGAFGDTAKN